MAMTKEQIRTAAMELDPIEREQLAEELLLTLPDSEEAEIDAAQLEEAKRRSQAYSEGRETAKPVEEVIARLRARAGQ